jgi:hypothetical protein
MTPRNVIVAGMLCLVAPRPARATDPYEIQVYVGDIDRPGQAGLELHTNVVGDARATSPTLLHATLEPSLGVLEWWELGAYLQFVMEGTEGHFGGFKLRSKFIVPSRLTGKLTLGVNLEVGRGTAALGTGSWGTEVRPIVAYARGRWFAAVNPIFGWVLSPAHAAPEIEPCAKLQYDAGHHVGIGLEYYSGLGPLTAIPAWAGQQHILFAAADLLDGPFELNAGLGRGLTGASDGWTFKVIVGKAF